MSASPPTSTIPSTKRPLEDPSSPSGPNDQPDPKRLALDKVVKNEEETSTPISEPESSVAIPADGAKVEPATETSIPVENGSKDGRTDAYVSDAPNGTGAAIAVPETHPIQSTASHSEHVVPHTNMQPHQDETGWVHIRAVISSAEAATCIGKGGENVSQIRRLSGAKCTVSDYSRGAVERILTVSGMQDAAAKVRHIVCVCPMDYMLICSRRLD